MALSRDYQRSSVYKAERAVFDIEEGLKHHRDMEWCADYAEVIKNSDHWKKHKGWKRVTLHHGAGYRMAKYQYSKKRIVLPKWARSKQIMIHEFAHCLTHRTIEDHSGHGTYFCGHYLKLVEELLGDTAAKALTRSFENHGVRYKFL